MHLANETDETGFCMWAFSLASGCGMENIPRPTRMSITPPQAGTCGYAAYWTHVLYWRSPSRA